MLPLGKRSTAQRSVDIQREVSIIYAAYVPQEFQIVLTRNVELVEVKKYGAGVRAYKSPKKGKITPFRDRTSG